MELQSLEERRYYEVKNLDPADFEDLEDVMEIPRPPTRCKYFKYHKVRRRCTAKTVSA